MNPSPIPSRQSPRLPCYRSAVAAMALGLTATDAVVASVATGHEAPAPVPETVVLLHGWWSNPLSMLRLKWSLQRDGYHVVNLGYRSVRVPLEDIAAKRLPRAIARRVPSNAPRVHFVTHSLGALLLREYLAHHPPANLGRIVMLGPPNQGSELAGVGHGPFLQWIAGPNYRYLTLQSTLRAQLPTPSTEIGVVAGSHPGLHASRKLPTPHDGRVSVDATRLPGMTDHAVVPAGHSRLPWSSTVVQLVKSFLVAGRFHPSLQPVHGQ